LDDSEDINEEEIYFIKNTNIKENNIINFNNIDKKTIIPSEKNIEENFINQKRKQGRKKKNSLEEGQHNKKTFDNILRRIKISLLNSFRILLNSKIKNVYKFKNLRAKWKLLKINPKHARNSNIEFNKVFIHKSLKEIFSEETTIKNLCNRDHNKILIKQLLNEKNTEKRKIFEILFNLTFLDLMKYSVGERPDLIELQGLSLSQKLLNEMALDEEYSELIFDILKNIETILENKFPRNKNKKNI
jgi:transposase